MNRPRLIALFTVLLWSFGSYLTRLIAIRSEFLMLAVSFFFTFLALFAYNFYLTRSLSFFHFRGVHFKFIAIGLLGYFVYMIGLTQSSRYFNSMSETTILNYTWPVFTVVFTELVFCRRTKPLPERLLQILGITCGFAAVYVLATRGNLLSIQLNPYGILFGLGAGVSYGIYSAYSGTLGENDQGRFLLFSILTSLVCILFLAVPEARNISAFTLSDLAVTFLLGFVLNGFGYILWTRANRLAQEQDIVTSVASIMFLLPVTSLILVSILLNERSLFQPYFLVSLALILVSFILCVEAERLTTGFFGPPRSG